MEPSNAFDFSLASEALTTICQGITGFFTDNWLLILGVVAIPLGFWLVRFCINLVKGLSRSSK